MCANKVNGVALKPVTFVKMTEKEFDNKFVEALDTVLAAMAESPDVAPEKFFSMACILENLRFFSPVLYQVLQHKEQ